MHLAHTHMCTHAHTHTGFLMLWHNEKTHLWGELVFFGSWLLRLLSIIRATCLEASVCGKTPWYRAEGRAILTSWGSGSKEREGRIWGVKDAVPPLRAHLITWLTLNGFSISSRFHPHPQRAPKPGNKNFNAQVFGRHFISKLQCMLL